MWGMAEQGTKTDHHSQTALHWSTIGLPRLHTWRLRSIDATFEIVLRVELQFTLLRVRLRSELL